MRKRAMVLGLLLVPLATGGAVLLAKSSHQSAPKSKATISLPSADDTHSEHSPGEAPGFVLAPSEAADETRDIKQRQSEEQRKHEAESNSSEDVDSDHAARQVLLASDSTSAATGDGPRSVAFTGRGSFNSYAFANSRSSGTAGSGGGGAQPVGSSPAADSKTPQGSSDITDDGAPNDTHEPKQPDVGDSAPAHDANPDQAPNEPKSGDPKGEDPKAEDQPPKPNYPVPYFPPIDERPHVTVPEPSTLMLLGLGLIACAAASRRRREKVK